MALSKLVRPPSESIMNSLKVAPITCASGKDLGVDGFNVLITIESALRGEVVYICSDGVVRDLSLAYSSYRPSEKFEESVRLLKEIVEEIKPRSTTIYLDSPVSGSGQIASRMRSLLGDLAEVTTSKRVDSDILKHEVVASSDSLIISRAKCVVDLPRRALERVRISPKPLFPLEGQILGLED